MTVSPVFPQVHDCEVFSEITRQSVPRNTLVPSPALKYVGAVKPSVSPQPATVCLLSSDPLLIADFQGLLYVGGFQFRTTALNANAATEVPPASVYAIEARDSSDETDSIMADLLSRFPGARVLIIAPDFSEESAFPLLAKGVRGLVRRSDLREQLSSALTAIAVGGFWVPRTLLARFVDSVIGTVRRTHFALGQAELSDREQQLLDSVLENLSDREIAQKLNATEEEIAPEIGRLAKKFGVRRRDDLILLAFPKPA